MSTLSLDRMKRNLENKDEDESSARGIRFRNRAPDEKKKKEKKHIDYIVISDDDGAARKDAVDLPRDETETDAEEIEEMQTMDDFESMMFGLTILPKDIMLKITTDFVEEDTVNVFSQINKNTYAYYNARAEAKLNKDGDNNRKKFSLDPAVYAAKYGNLETLKGLLVGDYIWPKAWSHTLKLHSQNSQNFKEQNRILKQRNRITNTAAEYGHLELLIWAMENGAPFSRKQLQEHAIIGNNINILEWIIEKCFLTTAVFVEAARYGKIEIIKWLKEEKNYAFTDGRSNNKTDFIMFEALHYGNTDIADWLIEEGCDFDGQILVHGLAHISNLRVLKWMKEKGFALSPLTCRHALQKGNLDVLKWGIENLAPFDSEWCRDNDCGGDLETLKWVCQYKPECKWHFLYSVCDKAAAKGQLDVVMWAREQRFQWTEKTCDEAAKNGYFKVVKWARENGCPWSELTCDYAAKHGRLDFLQWASSRKEECPLSDNVCTQAAENGHIEILQWASKKGCGLKKEALSAAAGNGHLDVVEWLLKEGILLRACKNKTDKELTFLYACNAASGQGHLHVLKHLITYNKTENYVYGNRISTLSIAARMAAKDGEWDIVKWVKAKGGNVQSDVCSIAAKFGRLDILKWAKDLGFEVHDDEVCTEAAKIGRLDILQWARENKCKWDHTTWHAAAEGGHLDVLKWGLEKRCTPYSFEKLTITARKEGFADLVEWMKQYA